MNPIEKLAELQDENNIIKFNKSWQGNLEISQTGNVKKSITNIKLVFDNDEGLANIGRTNIFSGLKEIESLPPWRAKDDENFYWTDADDAQLRNHIGINYGIDKSGPTISDMMEGMFYANSYHPIRDYLNSIEWDGKPRVDTFFSDFLGAEDTNYTRTVTRKMLVAGIARVFEPGVKFDNALILMGGQGIGKSHTLSRIGGEWFNESLNSFKGDEAMKKIQESWIIELAELSALKASDIEEAKSFISALSDTFRPSYGKNVQRFPRQCVFFGSTNNFEFLKDTTGNRRFWPLRVGVNERKLSPFKDLTDEYVNQLWSEAYHHYKEGEKLYLEDEQTQYEAEQMQTAHTSDDGVAGLIEEYLNEQNKVAICAREIWHECYLNDRQPKRHHISDINAVLRGFSDWEDRTNKPERFGKYGVQRGFYRKD